MKTSQDDLRIYVACLASYNAGILHGVWIDCEGKDEDELQEEVNAMLAASPEPNAEEYAIHDFEGFGSALGEYSGLSEVAELTEKLEEHGPAWLAFVEHEGSEHATEERFGDMYAGEWDSEKDYAEDYADDFLEIPEHLQAYFDYEAYARDLFIDSYFSLDNPEGGVFVFRRM